ncbi:mobilization protein [Kitasatospora sp. NBC_01287]|uniref:relaxase/mobilization nuclease domain-containing protein n=1 Tax=Kitasatospora sp. NBC_01287 TaxID=2903573 RepID=UPI0022552134|nr:relaxase/mobilization nuclease domain-containing protein [Kitasatospora sp. NBC_01287]MCX4748029.1 mobilization protein [Kitasatospora sp. NBC_01287]
MVPDVSTGSRTRGLLSYLFGPGRRDEHTDPHIVAAFAMPGLPDPGRSPLDQHQDLLTELADYLDQPVRAREQRLGAKVPQHVWHCPVRTAHGDRYLTDAEWAEVARRIVHATGIAPDGDDKGCRWIAVRHADDHIHIMATSVREDGRRPRNKRDGQRAQAECRKIEKELGLRQLNSGDGTAAPMPTSAEQAKAQRAGHQQTAKEWLQEQAQTVTAASRDEQEYFSTLTALGIQIRYRIGPETGDVLGYSLARPGDVNAAGEPVYFGGSTLAPDLSINRLRERLAAQQPTTPARGTVEPDRWRQAETTLRSTLLLTYQGQHHPAESDAVIQAQAAAFGELLHTAALSAPDHARAELRAAASAFNHANRSRIRAEHQQAVALRSAAKQVLHAADSGEGGTTAALLSTAMFTVIAIAHWHQTRGHQQQAHAAQQALVHLRTAYRQTAEPVIADLTRCTPTPKTADRLAAQVQTAIPDHAQRILADPSWPALATALAQAESAGQLPRRALTEAAQLRELTTADRPAEVLLWRLRNATADRIDQRAQAARARTTSTTANPTLTGPAVPTGAKAANDPTRRR